MNDILLYIGSGVITVWGIAHIIPTKNVVNGFGTISDDNRRIITMEWVAEGSDALLHRLARAVRDRFEEFSG